MFEDASDLTADRARLEVLRCQLGVHLATYRQAAGLSQPTLAEALGYTRSALSKVEHGQRRMTEALWAIADDRCGAEGALIAEHVVLVQAESDYRARCRAQRRQARQAAARAQLQSFRGSPAPEPLPCPDTALIDASLAEELMQVMIRLVQSMDRRNAMRFAATVFAALGLSGLEPDEYMRTVQAAYLPARLDTHVIDNLVTVLNQCKRQEDKLGPYAVLDTVMAQHQLVHRLLEGDHSEHLHKALSLVDSAMAAAIGGYLIDMARTEEARQYFGHARRAAHDAGSLAAAAYAAANTSFAARLCDDTPAALDTAAAARSLAARSGDPQLRALAEQMAAGAYALDGQYDACLAARARAHDLLTNASTPTPTSPAYWVSHGSIDSQASTYFVLLNKHTRAVETASTAHAQYDRTYVGGYALCQVRLGHALAAAREIDEAARVLTTVASHAHLFPRLTADLQAARTLLQPWATTRAVTTLDTHLRAHRLLPPPA